MTRHPFRNGISFFLVLVHIKCHYIIVQTCTIFINCLLSDCRKVELIRISFSASSLYVLVYYVFRIHANNKHPNELNDWLRSCTIRQFFFCSIKLNTNQLSSICSKRSVRITSIIIMIIIMSAHLLLLFNLTCFEFQIEKIRMSFWVTFFDFVTSKRWTNSSTGKFIKRNIANRFVVFLFSSFLCALIHILRKGDPVNNTNAFQRLSLVDIDK